ncbi:MAG TPA: efflux RND transporter periplasmic adaptor subunit [Steroidobacteraceae bacterium]|nr:efflux RND transporter periplasmic adaptor subunit [Steroidobacteraceae bacterium]
MTAALLTSNGRVVTGFAVVVVALTLAACKPQAAPAPQAMPVTVASVLEREIAEWDEFTGRLEAIDSVEIRPRVTGYIDRIAFREGGEVKAGDLLFIIDPKPYQAELQRAEAQVSSARAQAQLAAQLLANASKLRQAGAISQDEFDERKSADAVAREAVRAAEAEANVARLNLGYTRVTSPIAGRVSKAEITEGNLVTGGTQDATLLTTVVSLDPIYAEFEGDEQIYLRYTQLDREGDRQSSRDAPNPVFMGLANEDGFPHEGHMVFVDNQVNPRTGTIRARAIFDNGAGLFTPGLFARIQLLGSGKYKAVLITDRAVGTDQDRKYVLVVNKEKTIEYRAVKLGRVVDGLRIVKEGLRPGELIVVNGLQRVRPGMPVTTTTVPMDINVQTGRGVPPPER